MCWGSRGPEGKANSATIMTHLSVHGSGGDVLLSFEAGPFRPPLRIAESHSVLGTRSFIPPRLVSEFAFPSEPLLGFQEEFDQL